MEYPLTAGIFPGQGSQAVGMGQEQSERYPIVRDTFAEADAILGFSLSGLCFEGPTDELKRTSNAQPALLTVSIAYWRLLASRDFTADVVAGHSLGEYSALVAAGALSFSDALRLVRRRGELMEEAAGKHPGGMAAIIGLDDDDVTALCQEVSTAHGLVVPANFNSPGQVVVSGESSAIEAIRAAAKGRGARAIPLAVSGAFHSPLMEEAARAFAGLLKDVPVQAPAIPVVPNVTAVPTSTPEAIRDALIVQITGSVHWVRGVQAMREMGAGRFVEIGPGNVLTGLVQRTLPDVLSFPVSDMLVE
ncbi:MAG: ACP S-malonyltransferase [Armatimonadota bacterium]